MESRSDCWLHLLQYLMPNAEIAASIKVAGRSIHPDIVTAITAALDAKDAERDKWKSEADAAEALADRYRGELILTADWLAAQDSMAAADVAQRIRTALKGKSGVLIADDDSPAVYQPMNLSGEAVGGRVVVPAKEKCEECNGSGTSCTGGNCCMTCSECNGTGTA